MKRNLSILLAISLLVASVLACGTPQSYSVEYKVSGSANSASITYSNAQGGTEQQKINLPWSKSFTVTSGSFLYISAQNEGDSGSVTCQILVNGSVYKTSTSSGAYVIADCSGSAGGS